VSAAPQTPTLVIADAKQEPWTIPLDDLLASGWFWESNLARVRRIMARLTNSPLSGELQAKELIWREDRLDQLRQGIIGGREVVILCRDHQKDFARLALHDLGLQCALREHPEPSSNSGQGRFSDGASTQDHQSNIKLILTAMRPHQWAKNLLIFVPLVAAHKLFEADLWARGLLAFIAFSALASAVYVVNDIMDAPSDRRHPGKDHRPFARGLLSAPRGLAVVGCLLVTAALLAQGLPQRFGVVLLLYFAANVLYTFGLKRLAGLDLVMLAGMYTARVLAGGAAAATAVSHWLASFCVFLFFGLACIKRYDELGRASTTALLGRGYQVRDAETIFALGVGSSMMSAVVLALYLSSQQAGFLYRDPEGLWILMAVHLFWIARVWTACRRGDMGSDPVLFVLRDPQSYAAAGAAIFAMWMAT
jgi:4-hydroxybenzoate polyprenyltransferase